MWGGVNTNQINVSKSFQVTLESVLMAPCPHLHYRLSLGAEILCAGLWASPHPPQCLEEHGIWLMHFFHPWFLALSQHSINIFGMSGAASHWEMSLLDTSSSIKTCLVSFIDSEILGGFFHFPFLLRPICWILQEQSLSFPFESWVKAWKCKTFKCPGPKCQGQSLHLF